MGIIFKTQVEVLTLMPLPWYRVHIVVLNDPGRLIAVHLVHTALVAGWAGSMACYELSILYHDDLVLNPIWRQGCLVVPFMVRLGVTESSFGWDFVRSFAGESNYGILDASVLTTYEKLSVIWGDIIACRWTFEVVAAAHIGLPGLCFIAGLWHWFYWDLRVFYDARGIYL